MKRRIWLLLCSAVVLLPACVPIGVPDKPQPPEVTALPTYPTMQQVVTPEPTLYADEQPPPTAVSLFQTADKPDAVLAYYNRILILDGWTADKVTTAGVQKFEWWGGCPGHQLLVTAVSLPSGATTVEVKEYELGCI